MRAIHQKMPLVLSLLAALLLGTWSVLLLHGSDYLQPLPRSAGTVAVALLITAALGAGFLSGWRWTTLLLLPAVVMGFLFGLSESLYDSGVELGYNPVLTYLLLLPVAIGLGAVAAWFIPRSARIAGAVAVLLPIAVFGWAAFRHARPIDRRPAHPRVVRWSGSVVTYGGVPVKTIEIRDPRAETANGVGIGDNLEIARRRYPGIYCFIPLGNFNTPDCGFGRGYGGVEWPVVDFIGDPIEAITIGMG